MANSRLSLRELTVADAEQLRRLAKRWTGSAPRESMIVKTAKLTGRPGYVLADGGEEVIVGFAIGVVNLPVLDLSWLCVDPSRRDELLTVLVRFLRGQFPNLDLKVRVPNDDDTPEFLASLRRATGLKRLTSVVPGATGKNRNASDYYYAQIPAAGSGSQDHPPTLGKEHRPGG
jgi:hypothetical protein